jgi:hypothetical protein
MAATVSLDLGGPDKRIALILIVRIDRAEAVTTPVRRAVNPRTARHRGVGEVGAGDGADTTVVAIAREAPFRADARIMEPSRPLTGVRASPLSGPPGRPIVPTRPIRREGRPSTCAASWRSCATGVAS